MTRGLIGRFTVARDGGWTGEIRTLSVEAKARLAPNDNQDSDRAPTFRVYVGQSHVGDAWPARTSADPPIDYLQVQLDEPSFPEPIQAALFVTGRSGRPRLDPPPPAQILKSAGVARAITSFQERPNPAHGQAGKRDSVDDAAKRGFWSATARPSKSAVDP